MFNSRSFSRPQSLLQKKLIRIYLSNLPPKLVEMAEGRSETIAAESLARQLMNNYRLRGPRVWLRRRVPAWLNVDVDRHFLRNFREAVSPTHSHQSGGPRWRRIVLYVLLDQCLE